MKALCQAFYISDEKFVFYTRMECWLWHNILIEMIHYTNDTYYIHTVSEWVSVYVEQFAAKQECDEKQQCLLISYVSHRKQAIKHL